MTRSLIGAALSLALLCPAFVSAQSAEERALARDMFQRGVEAAEERRWNDAVDAFERSQAISPRPATLFNLASALVQAGRLVEARERYRTFAGQDDGSELNAEARRSIGVLDGRIGRVTIEVDGLAPVDVVRLDGTVLGRATLGAPLPTDPGDHELVVLRGETELAREPFQVEEGGARSVAVRVAPLAEAAPPEPALPLDGEQDDADQDDGGADLAWLGILIGVVVAGGIAAGLATWVVLEQQTPVFSGTAGMFVLP